MRIALALAWVALVGLKFYDGEVFGGDVSPLLWIATGAELIAALLLFTRDTTRLGAILSVLLCVGFVVNLWFVERAQGDNCRCFGAELEASVGVRLTVVSLLGLLSLLTLLHAGDARGCTFDQC